MIRSFHIFIQCKMFLDHFRPERRSRDRDLDPLRVVGIPDRESDFLPHPHHRQQIDICDRRRILRVAVKQGYIFRPVRFQHLNRRPHLVHIAHAGREDHLFLQSRYRPQIRQIRDLPRGDLEDLQPKIREQSDAFRIKRRRQKHDVLLVTVFHQLYMHLSGQFQLFEHFILSLRCVCCLELIPGFPGSSAHKLLRLKGLKLDCIRAGIARRVDQPSRDLHVAVVVHTCFRYDKYLFHPVYPRFFTKLPCPHIWHYHKYTSYEQHSVSI